MMFTRILAAVRNAQGPSPVFEKALELAIDQNAKLMVFHSIESDRTKDHPERSLAATQVDLSDIQNVLSTKGNTALPEKVWIESLSQKAKKRGVEVQWLVEEGRPGKQIVELSQRWKADLVVIGRTRRSSLSDALFGTVSDYVIHHASCSLLLIQ
jgi:nucleotide-binding universal stress UspA family protein